MKGIFYNSKKSLCSIHSTGFMCYNILKKSALFDLIYTEEQYDMIDNEYDFIVVNHHIAVCNWITEEKLAMYKGKTFCIVAEVGLYSDDVAPINPKIYDHYIVIDPTICESENTHAFPRPLTDCTLPKHNEHSCPVIGSFGLAGIGKNWEDIIDLVMNEFEEAVIRINIPKATYVPEYIHHNVILQILNYAEKLKQKPKIEFHLTCHVFETEQDIVDWCSQNTINVFLYTRGNPTGLAAVTDQAIISERPLLVSSNPTFRHIHPYIKNSSEIGIKEAIRTTQEGVKKMKNDWSSENFLKKFEKILSQAMQEKC